MTTRQHEVCVRVRVRVRRVSYACRAKKPTLPPLIRASSSWFFSAVSFLSRLRPRATVILLLAFGVAVGRASPQSRPRARMRLGCVLLLVGLRKAYLTCAKMHHCRAATRMIEASSVMSYPSPLHLLVAHPSNFLVRSVFVLCNKQKGRAAVGVHALPRLQATEDPPSQGVVAAVDRRCCNRAFFLLLFNSALRKTSSISTLSYVCNVRQSRSFGPRKYLNSISPHRAELELTHSVGANEGCLSLIDLESRSFLCEQGSRAMVLAQGHQETAKGSSGRGGPVPRVHQVSRLERYR